MIASLVTALARAAVLHVDPEKAHGLTLKALASGLVPACPPTRDPRLARQLLGLDFPNPLGMAAGFDKNGEVPDALLAQGFGFTEAGTVTPLAQPGNPRPRIFRLSAERAVINRLGFNNAGHAAMLRRLRARAAAKGAHGGAGIVGVNIGANKESADRIADYVAGIEIFAAHASYFTVNVSSPNTPGLRDLQARGALSQLLRRALTARDEAAETNGRRVPVLLKIAPDMDDTGHADICEEAVECQVDGLIVSNTTLSREGLGDTVTAAQAGGLSGRPLFHRSTRMLARTRKLVGPDMVLVGVGGIDSGETAWSKITAGADLIQLYTGFIYEGPGLIAGILGHLSQKLDANGFATIGDAVGSDVDTWAQTDNA